MRRRGPNPLLCFSVLVLAMPALAQVDSAALTGTVQDPTGTPVGDATVVLTHILTNRAVRVGTTPEGRYLATNLSPGPYLVEAEATGYATQGSVVILDVAEKGRLDIRFDLASVELEKLLAMRVLPEPGRARRLLATEQAALGTVIDQAFVSKLPLAIRNWDDLLALVAGVQGDRYTEEFGSTTAGRTGGVNIHGVRSLYNNFLLDGVENNTLSTNVQELSTQVARPSIDAIEEFKVSTSPYSAEYGHLGGGAVSVATKSGGSAFHGTLYDYYRNARFDANTFFARREGRPKPANDQNQFGGNLGGPLRKDRAFFFLDYEGTRITRGVTRQTRVPTELERRGVFTGPIRDPVTGQPFPGNAIPPDRIDPIAARLLSLLPLPNAPGANNFVRNPEVTDDADRVLLRVDLHLSDRDSLFGRYIYTKRHRYVPGFFGGTVDGTVSSSAGRQNLGTQGLVLGWTRRFGPSVVNELRVAWSRARADALQDPFGRNGPEMVGLRGVPDDPRVNGGVVGVNIDGFGRIGSPTFLPKFQHTDQVSWQDTLSWLRGNHQVRIGADLRAPVRNEYMDIPATRGDLRFRGRFTGLPLADFLLGYVSDAELTNVYVVDQRRWGLSAFVQDDWKATGKLTLNLGVRYDFLAPGYEAANRQTNFDPATASLIVAKDGSLEDRSLVKPDWNNLAPRLGAVLALDETTVMRAGYGLFFNVFERLGSEDQLALNPPSLRNNSLSTNSDVTPIFLLRDGFPEDFLSRTDLSRLRIRAVKRELPVPKIHQWSLGVQKQLPARIVASADVVFALGRNLATLRNLNQPIGGSGPLPFPGFGPIEWREDSGRSRYHGLDLAVERRFSGGYGFGLGYTLSKSIDDTAEHLAVGGSASLPQDARDPESWEGPSDFDTRHRFVTAFAAELPFGEGKRWARAGLPRSIFGGWLLSGILTVRSGRPFTVTQRTNNVGQLATGLPDRVAGGEGARSVESWFDVSAFRPVSSGTFGNSGRNILRGPGWQTLDLSLHRRIRIGGRASLVLRWDVFNVLDRANLGLPDANVSSPTVGRITTLAGDPRIMQFSVRVVY